jgi:hypothetical protein
MAKIERFGKQAGPSYVFIITFISKEVRLRNPFAVLAGDISLCSI